jgi:(+)-trans-carveol dehydrogenase
VNSGVAELGRLDIASANAGILGFSRLEGMDDATWQDMIDVGLTGVWHTVKAPSRTCGRPTVGRSS